MTTDTLHTIKTEPVALFFLIAILILALMVGKDVIAWILMKLYEIFIQQNPVKI